MGWGFGVGSTWGMEEGVSISTIGSLLYSTHIYTGNTPLLQYLQDHSVHPSIPSQSPLSLMYAVHRCILLTYNPTQYMYLVYIRKGHALRNLMKNGVLGLCTARLHWAQADFN